MVHWFFACCMMKRALGSPTCTADELLERFRNRPINLTEKVTT